MTRWMMTDGIVPLPEDGVDSDDRMDTVRNAVEWEGQWADPGDVKVAGWEACEVCNGNAAVQTGQATRHDTGFDQCFNIDCRQGWVMVAEPAQASAVDGVTFVEDALPGFAVIE